MNASDVITTVSYESLNIILITKLASITNPFMLNKPQDIETIIENPPTIITTKSKPKIKEKDDEEKENHDLAEFKELGHNY